MQQTDDAQTSQSEKTAIEELYNIAERDQLSARKKRRLLDQFDVISGFDLIAIILFISEQKISGFLNIVTEKNEIFGITFSDGAIIQIDNSDQETYLGTMLVREGIISQVELAQILKYQNVRLGEVLLKSGRITPEQILALIYKQLVLRLTKLIRPDKIQISFSDAEATPSEVKVSEEKLHLMSVDWIFSCIDFSWLEAFYLNYDGAQLNLDTSQYDSLSVEIKNKIQEMGLEGITQALSASQELRVLRTKFPPETLLKTIHLLTLTHCLKIVMSKTTTDEEISKILKLLQSKPDVEKLTIISSFTKTAPNQIERLYENLNFIVEKSQASADVKAELLKIGMDIMLFPNKYKGKNEEVNMQSRNEAIKTLAEVKKNLISKNYFIAFQKLKNLKDEQLKMAKVEIYYLWCLLAQAIDTNVKVNLHTIQTRLARVRPEDKFEAEYFYVVGLYMHYQNKFDIANENFKKCVKLNSQFEKLVPKKRSFFSKLLKLNGIIFWTIFLSYQSNLFAQNVSTEEIAARMPLRYMNQYFNYSINEQEIQISQFKINPKSIDQFIDDEGLKPVDKSDCAVKKTFFSQLLICRHAEMTYGSFEIFINKQKVDPKGIVVVQDNKLPLLLEIKNNGKRFIELRTRKRRIVPYKISKDADSKSVFLDLVDLDKRRYRWEKTISTDDDSFDIERVDELLDLRQDFVFTDKNMEKNAINYTMALPKEMIIATNRFGLNLLAGYSSFSTMVSNFTSRINSTVGFGVKLLYEKNLSENGSAYTNISYYRASILEDQNLNIISQKSFDLIDFNVGYRQFLNLDWTLGYEFNYRNNFYSYLDPSQTNIYDIEKTSSLILGLVPEYNLIKTRLWTVVVDSVLGVVLPQQTKYGKTDMGFAIEPSAKLTYKLNEYRIYAGMTYSGKIFKNADAQFSNKELIYSFGFYYLF